MIWLLIIVENYIQLVPFKHLCTYLWLKMNSLILEECYDFLDIIIFLGIIEHPNHQENIF